MTQFLLDSHAHLDDADFDADREAVIERARAAGVRYLLVIGGGTGPDDLASSIPIAEKYDWVYAAVGVHPHEAKGAAERHFEQLRAAGGAARVLAVGEIGLDYYYDHSPRDVQKAVLIRQLEIARELKRPVVIHCRDAWADLGQVIDQHWRSSGFGGILHCFSGIREDAFRFLDGNFLISFAGNLTFKNAENLRAVAREIPADRLLTETDSPYLAPVPFRGKRNEPAYVREVTRALATLHNLGEQAMGQQVIQNFTRFFHLE